MEFIIENTYSLSQDRPIVQNINEITRFVLEA